MNQIAKDFLEVLGTVVLERLPSDGMARFVLKGVPHWLFNEVEAVLGPGHLEVGDGKTVVLVLVDETSSSPLPDPSSPKSGRYNLDRVTEIRNHFDGSWIAICPTGSELNASNLDTSSDLGEILEKVINHVLHRLFSSDPSIRREITKLWRRCKSANQVPGFAGGEELGWRLASDLAGLGVSDNTLDRVVSELGYIKCEGADLADGGYIRLLDEVAKQAEAEGLSHFFKKLMNRVPEIPSVKSGVVEALDHCLKHLRNSVVDGSSWSTRQNYGYAPLKEGGEPAGWWSVLDFETWKLLLADGGKSPVTKRKIDIRGGVEVGGKKTWILLERRDDAIATFLEDGIPTVCEWNISEEKSAFLKVETPAEELDFGNLPEDPTGSFRLKAVVGDESVTSKDLVPLWSHEIGIFPSVVGANTVGIPSAVDGEESVYESQIELPQEGTYTCILYVAHGVNVSGITGRDISPDLEGLGSEIKFSAGRGRYSNALTFQLQSDESCTYDIKFSRITTGDTQYTLRLDVDAGTESAGVSLSEYEALVASHVEAKQAGRTVSASRNDSSVFARLGGWLLDDDESWAPASLVAGKPLPIILSGGWRRSTPLNCDSFERDIRPLSVLSPPSELLSTRGALRESIRESVLETGGLIEVARLWEMSADENFARLLETYCNSYFQWLIEDEQASWFDTVTVHLPREDDLSTAAMAPTVLLLSPLHPLRLRWQVRVQAMLAGARDSSEFCYLASDLDPDSCPAYWQLRYGNIHYGFVASHGISKYWSVLVAEQSLHPGREKTEYFEALGLGLPGATRTLGGGQAYGMLSEVRDLLPAAPRLVVSLKGSVNASDRLFDGILDWFSKQSPENDGASRNQGAVSDWARAIPSALDIYDHTVGSAAPSSGPLASISESSQGSLNWFVGGSSMNGLRSPDLAMHTSLNVAGQQVIGGGAGAAATPGLEVSIFPVWVTGNGVVRTPVSFRSYKDSSLEQQVLFHAGADSGQYLETSFEDGQFQSDAALEGFPATGMDPAMVAHLLGEQGSHVWRYSRHGTGDDGYFVVAKSGPVIRNNMTAHLSTLDTGKEFSDDQVESILGDFGKRGLDSLHAAVGGGVAASGAIGLLVTSRVLQSLGERACILPDHGPNSEVVSVVVPLDSYEQKIVGIGRSLKLGASVPRPDFLVISVANEQGEETLHVKLTPIEAKCFSSTMTANHRSQVLDQQCRRFIVFLNKLFGLDLDSPESMELWSLGRRRLLAELFLSGGHILTHSSSNSWNTQEGREKLMDICAGLMKRDPLVEVDPFGRLVVVDSSSDTCFRHHDTTVDAEGFRETLQISRPDAAKLLANQFDFTLDIPAGDWALTASVIPSEAQLALSTGLGAAGQTLHRETVSITSNVDYLPQSADRGFQKTEEQHLNRAVETIADRESTGKVLPRISLGTDSEGSAVAWEPFKPDNRLPNGHCVIVGQSGSGKTYTIAQVMAPQVIESGAKLFALEFNDEFEDSSILDSTDAQRINVAHGMNFNPLVISQEESADYLNVTSHVYALADVLDTTFSLGVQQVSKLRNAIKGLYQSYGIEMVANFDPASVRAWPEFAELRGAVEALPGTDQLLGRIEVLFDTGVFRGREGTMTDLLEKTTIVSLKDLPGVRVQHAVSALLLRGVYSTLASMGQVSNRIRNVIVVDEAHKVANSQPIETLIKEIRKFGGAVWLSSQEPTDFKDSVWANCASFLCLRVEDVNQARLCSQKLDNNYELVEPIRELTVGNGYIRNNHYLPFRRIKLSSA